jgi:hypothetical protein
VEDETTPPIAVTPAKASESHLFNVSTRAWITFMIVGTICAMSAKLMKVEEPLYSMGTMVLGFYFGQVTRPKAQQ